MGSRVKKSYGIISSFIKKILSGEKLKKEEAVEFLIAAQAVAKTKKEMKLVQDIYKQGDRFHMLDTSSSDGHNAEEQEKIRSWLAARLKGIENAG